MGTQWTQDITRGIATLANNTTIAFYRVTTDTTMPFRIYDHTHRDIPTIQPASFLRSAQRVIVLTPEQSSLARYYQGTPRATVAPPSGRCSTCSADGFFARPTHCTTRLCYSCRTRGVYCNCMMPPKGLIQVSDTHYDIPDCYRTRITQSLGLLVGNCPHCDTKLPPFLSNVPYVSLFDPSAPAETGDG